MSQESNPSLPSRLLVCLLSVALALPATAPLAYAQDAQQSGNQQMSQAQLAALVAPVALYPDPLVAQVLMASTYPLEVAEAYNWQKANSRLKGDALNQALQQQNWDASVKSLVSFPPVLGMMGSQLSWTQELGNAVLAQQSDVMNAIQALRAKAKASGALQSNSQQTVTTQGSGSNETIVIQPANPQVVYVPSYNPSVVYGGWPYPAYPPYAYYPPGYVAGTALLSFGLGMAVGAALWGGCHWGGGGWGGGNSLTVNNNNFNNFNRNTNNNWSGSSRSGTSNWQADSQRRANNLSGGGNRMSGAGGGTASRDAERDQLRQNLDRGGLSGGDRSGGGRDGFSGSDRSGGERGGFSGGDRSGGERTGGGSRDPGGFGDTRHANFGSGDRFGGSGGSHFGGGGGSHFGGGGFGGRR
jgi:hypothetical protein